MIFPFLPFFPVLHEPDTGSLQLCRHQPKNQLKRNTASRGPTSWEYGPLQKVSCCVFVCFEFCSHEIDDEGSEVLSRLLGTVLVALRLFGVVLEIEREFTMLRSMVMLGGLRPSRSEMSPRRPFGTPDSS